MFQVWYSTEIFADYIIQNTNLKKQEVRKLKLMESDANNSIGFHRMPDHIKKILYLDAPDLIVEYNNEPIFSIEVSREAGSGHNAFQRFARIVASAENNVPALYIYPKAVQITRKSCNTIRWDALNPNIFKALEQVMRIHSVPALLFYYPSHYPNNDITYPNKGLIDDDEYLSCPNSNSEEMEALFEIINVILNRTLNPNRTTGRLINERKIQERRDFLNSEYEIMRTPNRRNSPISAIKIVDTQKVINYLKRFGYFQTTSLLQMREKSVIYQVDSKFRGDPYPGALAALDYLVCRTGVTFEERDKNLILCWGLINELGDIIEVKSSKNTSIEDMMEKIKFVKTKKSKCLLGNTYSALQPHQIPRYYMQVRYGCTYTKQKDIRAFAYFADAILFADGALWREA